MPQNNMKPSEVQVVLTEEQALTSLEVLNSTRSSLCYPELRDEGVQPVFYISDMHLTHKLKKLGCQSESDIKSELHQIARKLYESCCYVPVKIGVRLLVFVGDTCSNFQIFCWFLDELAALNAENPYRAPKPVFILGNHEVFGLHMEKNCSTRDVVKAYREAVELRGFYFLYNDLLCIDDDVRDRQSTRVYWSHVTILHELELQQMSVDELRAKTCHSRLLLLGSTGFSHNHTESGFQYIGQDNDESYVFDAIYEKCVAALYDRPVIIATHTPFCEWHELSDHGTVPQGYAGDEYRKQGFVYISGHTHQNFFYDDGMTRVYADNQFGYDNLQMKAKWLYVNIDVDIFDYYADGIYEMSRMDYIDFYRGKNLQMVFNRDAPIYMLKKKGYYAFFIKRSTWSILNGGMPHKIEGVYDIQQLYDHMDDVIAIIEEPLNRIMNYMKFVSDVIKRIGGTGRIHGCIVDIDYYNHIYINPVDGTKTPYFALNIVRKTIYASVPALLEERCPQHYAKYQELLLTDPSAYNNITELCNARLPGELNGKISMPYTNTGMYSISRVINKMQKLRSQVLTLWPNVLPKASSSELIRIRDSNG